MTIKEFKEKISKVDKRLWLLIFCVLLYIIGVVFFIGSGTGRAILNMLAYIAYIVGSLAGIIFLYSYLKTYFGLDKKKENENKPIEITCEIEEDTEKVTPKSEINYDLESVDDGEHGAPYSFAENIGTHQDSE